MQTVTHYHILNPIQCLNIIGYHGTRVWHNGTKSKILGTNPSTCCVQADYFTRCSPRYTQKQFPAGSKLLLLGLAIIFGQLFILQFLPARLTVCILSFMIYQDVTKDRYIVIVYSLGKQTATCTKISCRFLHWNYRNIWYILILINIEHLQA